jgi:AcrR family transcriptional regulator
MGRPREHDERTAVALLDAAERIVERDGLDALSVRRAADASGTTTRAVYTLFGAKEGLVVALGTRAFTLLSEAMDAVPVTDDPAHDLVEAGVVVFRRFTLGHPALFAIGFLHTGVLPEVARAFRTAQEDALARLAARIERLADTGRLGGRSVADAIVEFHALCEGLAALEPRGLLCTDDGEGRWRAALGALVAGWGVTVRDAGSDCRR